MLLANKLPSNTEGVNEDVPSREPVNEGWKEEREKKKRTNVKSSGKQDRLKLGSLATGESWLSKKARNFSLGRRAWISMLGFVTENFHTDLVRDFGCQLFSTTKEEL